MERMHHYISLAQLFTLKEIEKLTGITVSEQIRRAIDEYIGKSVLAGSLSPSKNERRVKNE